MFVWRALYLRVYGLLAVAITLWALWQLLHAQWLWLGPLLAWGHLPCINAWRYRNNFAYRDERERLAMTTTLLGVALVLIAGSREWALALTLAGLFGLLIYVFIASALPRGLREHDGDTRGLADLSFDNDQGRATLGQINTDKPVLLLVIHSAAHCYSRMAARELQNSLACGELPLQAEQCVLLFPGELPRWSQSLLSQGIQCWSDSSGESLAQLGLWLRGGNWSFAGGSHAARPLLAVLPANHDQPKLWVESSNFRVPPSLQDNIGKISRLL